MVSPTDAGFHFFFSIKFQLEYLYRVFYVIMFI